MAGCASTPAKPTADPSAPPPAHAAAISADPLEKERSLGAAIEEGRCVEHVRALVALGPRMGGTKSGERAAAYRRAAWEAAGLGVELVRDPAQWCHEESTWTVRAVAREPSGAAAAERVLASAWPWGFSPSAEGSAPLALEAAAGVALLAEHHRRPGGSVVSPALVLVDGDSTADGRHAMVHHLRAGTGNPCPVFAIGREDGAELRAWLASGRTVEVEYRLVAEIREAPPLTVVARLPARAGAPAGHFLFCAHGDSDAGGPGANDNGSGEAVVLEMARAYAAEIRAGRAPAPPRELRFAIWGSEIHSSRAYLAASGPGDGDLLGVINFDQAGYGHWSDQLNVEPDDLPANAGLVAALAAVLRDHAGTPGFPAKWATNRSLGGTDSYVFSDSAAFREGARPSVTVFASAWDALAEHPRTSGMPGESWSDRERTSVDGDPYYHSSGDTPENTTDKEPWNMGWCARVALLGALRWLEASR